jgi:BlaI family transcriptional regulator, penicillinase repressor
MKKQAMHGLGHLQAEVMEIVWEKGTATVTQVVEVIAARRAVTYTTVLVAMQKLEQKGWLKHHAEGRAYVYEPRRSREQVHGGVLREMLSSLFSGDPRQLVSQLLDARPMTQAELADLKRLIAARQRELSRQENSDA